MTPMKKLNEQYGHALDRMYDLFKMGVAKETELANALAAARGGLKRVKACPSADDEIIQICDIALANTASPSTED